MIRTADGDMRPGRVVLGRHFLENVIMIYDGFRARVRFASSSNRE